MVFLQKMAFVFRGRSKDLGLQEMDCITYRLCNDPPHDSAESSFFLMLISPPAGDAFWVKGASVRLGNQRNGLCNPRAYQCYTDDCNNNDNNNNDITKCAANAI